MTAKTYFYTHLFLLW